MKPERRSLLAIDALPPTQASLIHHIKRAVYQAGHCWSQAMMCFHHQIHGGGAEM